jgi:hypothetical protein
MNKSDLVVAQRNSIMSLDFKPSTNKSFNQNLERRSIFDNSSQQLGNNNTGLDQNQYNENNITSNNTNTSTINNTEAKFISNPNISYSTLLNERSNSIFSTNSNKSIKIPTQMNPRVSVIAKANQRMSNFGKEKLKNIARFSLLLPEHTFEDKIEEIDDKCSEMSSDNSMIDDNLDSSGEFTQIMKKDQPNSKKNSIFSKNLKIFDRTNSIVKLDSLSIGDLQRLREAFNNNEVYNEQGSTIIIKEKENEFSFEDSKYREQLLDYLKINNYKALYQKIFDHQISPKELITLEEDKIAELVEEENNVRVQNLKRFVTDLDDAHDYDDLLKKIDNDILNGKIFG